MNRCGNNQFQTPLQDVNKDMFYFSSVIGEIVVKWGCGNSIWANRTIAFRDELVSVYLPLNQQSLDLFSFDDLRS